MGLNQTKKASAQQTNSKMKRQPADWDNIFPNRISDKGFYPKYLRIQII